MDYRLLVKIFNEYRKIGTQKKRERKNWAKKRTKKNCGNKRIVVIYERCAEYRNFIIIDKFNSLIILNYFTK